MTDRHDDAFAEHLHHPVGAGHAPRDAHEGAAGGAACGDLVVIRVAVHDDRVADAGFDASGCGAIRAAASATVDLIDGTPILDAARIGAGAISAALGGLSPGKFHAADLAADALHRALGAAVAADAMIEPRPDRTLVAMSGGVDSAVAALLTAQTGEAVGVTVELWRDPANDAERSCCSATAVRRARALAHQMGLAHLTLDLRDEFAAGVVEPWLAGHAAGETPNPCVRCNGSVRLDAMLDLAARLGAPTLATGHYARITPDGLLRAATDDAKDQSYMLAALPPRRSRACASRSAPSRSPRSASSPPTTPSASPRPPTPRTSASSPASARTASSPPTATSRHARATSSPRTATSSATTAATTATPWASAAASASPHKNRCTSSPPTREATSSRSALARHWRRRASPCATSSCTRTPSGSTTSACATAPPSSPVASTTTPRSSTARSSAPPPARPPSCSTATSIVGHATIA